MSSPRMARVKRKTTETDIDLSLTLDGAGLCRGKTGIGFFDHMLTTFAGHALFDLQLTCSGDLEVDAHHTVEDIGICAGQVLAQALGDKAGITRFGQSYVPMDETLARAVVDVSGRPYLVYEVPLSEETVGAFPAALAQEFFRALADHAMINLHVDLVRGSNAHHEVEAIFKAVARALRSAVRRDPEVSGIPSTKGVL